MFAVFYTYPLFADVDTELAHYRLYILTNSSDRSNTGVRLLSKVIEDD